MTWNCKANKPLLSNSHLGSVFYTAIEKKRGNSTTTRVSGSLSDLGTDLGDSCAMLNLPLVLAEEARVLV